MTLRIFYYRQDFWGKAIQTEETREAADLEDLKKAFRGLKKDRTFALHIESEYVLFWDTYEDYNNGVLTVRKYTARNSFDEVKKSYDKARKDILSGL